MSNQLGSSSMLTRSTSNMNPSETPAAQEIDDNATASAEVSVLTPQIEELIARRVQEAIDRFMHQLEPTMSTSQSSSSSYALNFQTPDR